MYGNYWRSVATVVPGRTSSQVRNRARFFADVLKKGRWSKEEDAGLVAAVAQMGTKWKQVAQVVSGRSEMQCRERWLSHHQTQLDKSKFELADREKLERLVNEIGEGQWAEIAKRFPSRDRTQIIRLWKSIKKFGVCYENMKSKKRKAE
jgi:myb proto-oncogene protein